MNNNLPELIAVAVASAMAGLIEKLGRRKEEKELWTAKDIAFHMGVGHRQVLERYAPLPSFPKAVRVGAIGGARGQPLWYPEEVRKWWRKHQDKN